MEKDASQRFDKLLKAMSEGEAPSARKSASAGRASGAERGACSSDTQTPNYGDSALNSHFRVPRLVMRAITVTAITGYGDRVTAGLR